MLIPPAQRLAAVQEYYFSRKLQEIAALRAQGVQVINLGIGSPDLPPEPSVVEEVVRQSRDRQNHAYQSYRGIPQLREAFADWYGRHFGVGLDPETEILPLMGSKEGILHLSMSFLDPGDAVLIPNPGYPTYAAEARLAGADVRFYPLTENGDWMPDLGRLESTDLSNVKMMWLNYPHMPTGAAATPELFRQLVAFARRHRILLVNDNPYSFVLNDHPLSLLSTPGAKEVALELNSLSKSHNMAGWRLGCLAGRADYLQAVLRFKSNMDSGMFQPLQAAAARALQLGPDWYRSLNTVYRERRDLAVDLLRKIGCRLREKQVGMFLWAEAPAAWADGYELSDHLLREAAVFLTPGGIFGENGRRYVRLSLCSDHETLREAARRIEALQLAVRSQPTTVAKPGKNQAQW